MGHVYFYPKVPPAPNDASRPTSKRRSQNALSWAVVGGEVEGEIGASFTPNSIVPMLKGKR